MQNPEKKSFMMGLVSALAIIIVLGGVYMLGAKYGQGGGTSNTNKPTAQQPTAQQPTAQQPTGPEGDATKIAAVSSSDHIRGDANAPITMIEYSDFQCPYCERFHQTVQQIMTDYKGKVRLVYRNFPLRSIHPNAEKAAEASECASTQGKFWEMHDKLFALNAAGTLNLDSTTALDAIKKAAKEIGLDTSKFNTCLDTGAMASVVDAQEQDGVAGGVAGTPGTFVNGQYLAGALPYAEVKPILDSLLK